MLFSWWGSTSSHFGVWVMVAGGRAETLYCAGRLQITIDFFLNGISLICDYITVVKQPKSYDKIFYSPAGAI